MNLNKFRFDGHPQTWATAIEMAQEFLPHEGITYEHRYNAQIERRLLAVLLLAAHRDEQEDLAYVESLAQKLDDDPVTYAATLWHPDEPEANKTLEDVLKSVGSLFCEPTKQLLLSLRNFRSISQPSGQHTMLSSTR